MPLLTEEANTARGEASGLGLRAPKVEFDRYVYKSISKWGKKVGDVGILAEEMAYHKEVIKQSYAKIADINTQLLDKNLSVQTREELESLKKGMYGRIK